MSTTSRLEITRAVAALATVATGGLSLAGESAPHRELWVPSEHLEEVLKSRPRAVILTPKQYRTLLRDAVAGAAPVEPEAAPPVAAVVREVRYEGEIGPEIVRVVARYSVENFTDAWSEIPLALPSAHLARVEVDAESALRVAAAREAEKPTSPLLLTRGKGRHEVVAEFHLPVTRSPSGNAFQLTSHGVAAASLELRFPEGARLDSELPFVIDPAEPALARFALPAGGGDTHEIRWTARAIAAIPDAAIFQTCRYLYSIDSTRVQADLGLVLSSPLAELPRVFSVNVSGGARVLSVEGSELLRWSRDDATGALAVELVEGKRRAADLRVLVEADVDLSGDTRLVLPIAEVAGVHRASGTLALLGGEGVRVKNIVTGPLTVAAPEALDPAVRDDPHFVAGFRFPVTTTAPEVTLSPVRDRFTAQLDTRIELRREAVHLTRQLSIMPLEGRLFSAELILPEGEELVGVAAAIDGVAGFDWRRMGSNRVGLRWQQGLVPGDAPSLTITSRRDPEDWFALGETPVALDFAPASLPAAESVSGYVAVVFDESFRVETGTTEGLDPRDGRTTPVTGNLAWFRLADFALTLSAARRVTEIEAAVTAYALPLQSTLEIEGQLDLDIRHSPVSELVVATDPAVAGQLRFDSPLLAEKRLDAETGAWTLVFHDEQTGFRRLRFRMALPFETEDDDADSGQKRFTVRAPVLSVPAAKRLRGDWIVEANTDTELTFATEGLDAVDSLRAPTVADYRPRHRVIAAWQYRGDDWGLSISGTRHAPEELVSTVIDSLRIDTVVSTDGEDRHQAVMRLRTSGEQFLDIGLPEDALVWTLTVDDEAVKPVRADTDALRVQLPAREVSAPGGDALIELKLVYQTPGREWGGSGREKLEPIRLAARIPVMRSEWRRHLPDGYDYQKFRGNLREEFQIVDRTLMGRVWRDRERFLPGSPDRWGIDMSENPELVQFDGYINYKESLSEREYFDYKDAPGETKPPISVTAGNEHTLNQSIGHGQVIDLSALDLMPAAESVSMVEEKLKSIVLPSVDFVETPLREAVANLGELARQADPEGMGVDIATTPELGGFGGEVGDTPITLKLQNVPLAEALRYTAALANLKYRAETDAVRLIPLSAPDQELYTNVYRVPMDFLSAAAPGGAGGGGMDPFAAPVDAFAAVPFSNAQDEGNANQAAARKSAKEVLESYGIVFSKGSSASYNPQTGELIVRNSQDQMELVEAVTQSIRGGEVMTPQIERFATAQHEWQDYPGLATMEELVDSESGERLVLGRELSESATPALNDVVLDTVTFDQLPLADAVDRLESQAAEVLGKAREEEGAFGTQSARLSVALDADGETARRPVSLDLRNITLGEALAHLTNDTGTEFRVTASGVVIAQPSAIPEEQLSTLVVELPNSAFETDDGNGGLRRHSARGVLTDAGIEFPAGTSAAYNFATRRLAVRNTPENLDEVRALFADHFPPPSSTAVAGLVAVSGKPVADSRLKGFDARNAGLIPIDFALPESGRSYVFTGPYAPESIQFRYVNWERQVRFAWIWMLAGGLGYWLGAARKLGRPVFAGLLGVVILTFLPLIVSRGLLGFCNSLLIGWLAAAALWLLWRLCDRATVQVEAKPESSPAPAESAS